MTDTPKSTSPILEDLVELLTLEKIEEHLFRGRARDLGWGTLFGGHVLGQALSAAGRTVPPDRLVHSLHSYFLRPGKVDVPIIYEVDRIRDGRSFTTRRVVAIQGGKAIFNLSASFQVEEPGFEHQTPMPSVPGPDGLLSEQQIALKIAAKIPASLRERAVADRPIEIRPIEQHNPLNPTPQSPHRALWYRASGPLPDDPALHRLLLAYASDFNFVGTAMLPHGVSWLTPGMQVASLDHAMWFHRPFRADEWLLYTVSSPTASGARGVVRGRFYDQQGRLVCSTMQEGLMRDRRPKSE
ncbi:MAG: acyl-CoA thioesterase-2 [Bradymonadia bacterium]|jgi:acyl-CoA thioesterase-2